MESIEQHRLYVTALDEFKMFENGIPYPAFFGKSKAYVSILSDPHEFIVAYVRYWVLFL